MSPKARNILMAVVIGVIVAAALVMVIVFVVIDDQPTLVHPERRWVEVPVSVTCVQYAPSAPTCGIVQRRVAAFNSAVGFEMYRYDASSAQVGITLGTPVEAGADEPGGVFELRRDGDTYTSCDIRTMNTGGVEFLAQVIDHELGHCAGLAHDDSPNSKMYPLARERPSGGFGQRWRDGDLAALREQYR